MPTLNDLEPKDGDSDAPVVDDPGFFSQMMTLGMLASTGSETSHPPRKAAEILAMAGRTPTKEDEERFWSAYASARAMRFAPEEIFDFEVLRDEGWAPDEARLTAASALASGPFRRPVHHERWRMVQSMLFEQAELHGRRPEAELRERVVANLFEAIEAVRQCDPTDPDTWRVLRGKINRLVTEDILGPAWRRAGGDKGPTEVPLPEEEELCAPEEEKFFAVEPIVERVEAELTLAALIAGAGLSLREAEVVAHLLRDENLKEIADLLAISPSTARVHWHHAIKKLRPV